MIKKITNWLSSFLELQLIISLLSLPALIHWGIAISCMLPIANMIFSPLLALFLWCSCLLALCSIVGIPCSWLTTILDWLAIFWHYLLSFAQPSWLIGFQHHMLFIAIPVGAITIFVYTFFYPTKKMSLLFLICCTGILFSMRWITLRKNCFYRVKDLEMHVFSINNKTFLLDSGALCSKQNFYSWIDYTIIPELIKTGGITTIDTLFLYKPSKNLVKVVQQFCQQTLVKHVLVTTKNQCYHDMKIALKDSGITVSPIKPRKEAYDLYYDFYRTKTIEKNYIGEAIYRQ